MDNKKKEKSEGEKLAEKLLSDKKNGGLRLSEEKIKKADKFCEGYKSFLNTAKTEREAVIEAVAQAEKAGFKPYEKGKKYQFEESIDLSSEEIKTLRDIGLYVISEKNRDHILYPKNFEDYFNLLKKLQESGIDINSIIASDNLRIIKFNSIYKFEIIKKNVKKAKDDSNNTLNNLESNQVNIIKIGKKVTAFRKGKNSVATDSEPLSDDNLENLQSIGFNTPYLKRLEREINPKTFTDYFNLLKKLQNYGVDINKITRNSHQNIKKGPDNRK